MPYGKHTQCSTEIFPTNNKEYNNKDIYIYIY